MVSLKKLIPILTVTPLMATLGFTGLLGIYNGDKTVYELSSYWMSETVSQIKDQIRIDLKTPRTITNLNFHSIQSQQLDWKEPDRLGIHFAHQIQLFTSVNSIYFGDRTQSFVSAQFNGNRQITQSYIGKETESQLLTYATNLQGEKTKVVRTQPGFDPQTRPWYKAAQNTNNPVWSPVYPDFTTRQLGITAAQAVRDRQGNLVGVLGVDFFLNDLNEFLRDLSISRVGQALILEEDGKLIVSSNPDDLTILDPESKTHFVMTDSPDPVVRDIGEKLIAKFSDFSLVTQGEHLTFHLQGKKQWVWIEPFENQWGLKWLIVVIVAEEDIFSSQDKQIIKGVITLIAIIGSLLAVFTMHRLVVSPLLRLNTTAKKLKNRQFQPEKIADLVQRNDEIGQFSRVFEEMAIVIQERQTNLEERINILSSYKTYSNPKIVSSPSEISAEQSDEAPEITLNYWDYLKQKSQQIRQKNQFNQTDD